MDETEVHGRLESIGQRLPKAGGWVILFLFFLGGMGLDPLTMVLARMNEVTPHGSCKMSR